MPPPPLLRLLLLALLSPLAADAGAPKKEARHPCEGRRVAGVCSVGGGRYVVGRRLGGGSFGQVWAASRAGESAPSVALKFVDTARNADVLSPEWADALRAMRMEVELLRALAHPHVLHLVETLEENDYIIIVTDLAAGDLISSVTSRAVFGGGEARRPAPEALVRRLLHEVGSAVAYVHAHGIVHRDIKPDNVLVGRGAAGALVLADLGLAVMSREYEASLAEAVPEGEERDARMSNELFDDHGAHDADGNGIGDRECGALPPEAGAAASAGDTRHCARAAVRKAHLRVNGVAGTRPYLAREVRDHWDRFERNHERYIGEEETEAIDIYSLGATAFELMRGTRLNNSGPPATAEGIEADLAASGSSYSAELRAAVVSMLDASPSSRARLVDVFKALGVRPVPSLAGDHPLLDVPAGFCEAHRDCDDCAAFPACAWCSSARRCVRLNAPCAESPSGRGKLTLPSSCSVSEGDMTCEEINSCGLCAAQRKCAFCPSPAGSRGNGTCRRLACPAGVERVERPTLCRALQGGGGAPTPAAVHAAAPAPAPVSPPAPTDAPARAAPLAATDLPAPTLPALQTPTRATAPRSVPAPSPAATTSATRSISFSLSNYVSDSLLASAKKGLPALSVSALAALVAILIGARSALSGGTRSARPAKARSSSRARAAAGVSSPMSTGGATRSHARSRSSQPASPKRGRSASTASAKLRGSSPVRGARS